MSCQVMHTYHRYKQIDKPCAYSLKVIICCPQQTNPGNSRTHSSQEHNIIDCARALWFTKKINADTGLLSYSGQQSAAGQCMQQLLMHAVCGLWRKLLLLKRNHGSSNTPKHAHCSRACKHYACRDTPHVNGAVMHTYMQICCFLVACKALGHGHVHSSSIPPINAEQYDTAATVSKQHACI
jgi:hypothetical protein